LSELSNVGYEGNAQTFRILNNIEEKHYEYNGLNLTIRSLLGVVKYPNSRSVNKDKFLYEEDYENVSEWKNRYSLSLKTIDCEIMDIADEIAYAAHDLEDALCMGYFTSSDILYEFSVSSKFKEAGEKFGELVERAKDYAMKSKTYETSEEYSILFHKELTSLIVNTLINDVGVVDGGLGYTKYEALAKGLKKLIFRAVSRRSEVAHYEIMGERVLKGIFEVYMDRTFNKGLRLMPAEYRFEEEWERSVLDYIGGMMDGYAIRKYKEYYGESSLCSIYEK